MSDSRQCPTCGVVLMPPRFPSIETTTWSDDCACSDMVTCVGHRMGGELPKRPPQEVLKARADQRYQAELERFARLSARFAACYPDDPEMDATDGAHPAWWRGHDHVAAKLQAALAEARARSQACETLLTEIGEHLVAQPDADQQRADYRKIVALLGLRCALCDRRPCVCTFDPVESGDGWWLLPEAELVGPEDEWMDSSDSRAGHSWAREVDDHAHSDVGRTVAEARARHGHPGLLWRRRLSSATPK